MTISCLYLVLFLIGSNGGSRILLLPADHHPHVNFFALAGKHLAEAGHDVVLVTMERHKILLENIGVPHILHRGLKASSLFQNPGHQERNVFRGGKLGMIKPYAENVAIVNGQCDEMLGSKELTQMLDNKVFDIALVDGNDFVRCLYIFPYLLGIPYITLTSRHDPWQARIPALPSVEGHPGLYHLTSNSSLIHRFINTMLYVTVPFLSWLVLVDAMISRHVPNKPATTFSALFQNSELFLVNIDTLCLEGPRVSSPHYQIVGHLGSRPPKSLPPDLETFVTDAEDGVIVFTFGSTIKTLPSDIVDKLFHSFEQLPQRVVMGLEGNNWKDVPSNVRIAEWLPQNDLLGHIKTRLFITHCGNNGRMEALYHGVAMLCMPLFGDQKNNAIQIVNRRLGLRLDWDTFTSEELVTSINEIINNPIYRENIQKCSKIVKDFPSPQETTTFWVEHILKFGSSHLRPPYIEMPLWKFFMLDIILVVSLIILCTIFIVYRCCRFVHRKCCGETRKQKAD